MDFIKEYISSDSEEEEKEKKFVCQQKVFTNQQRQKMKSVLGHNLAEIILKMKLKLIQTKIQKKK